MGLLTFSFNVTLDGCVDHQEGIADDETHAFFTRLMDEGGAMLWGTGSDRRVQVPRSSQDRRPRPDPVPERAARHATARAGLGEPAQQRRGRHALPARGRLRGFTMEHPAADYSWTLYNDDAQHDLNGR
jgi:hypothetical protein